MKKFFLFALVATLFAACSTDATQDLAPEIPTSPDELYVSFDDEASRIQLGENGSPVWTKGDLVSVFYKSNANQQWQFQGKTGDTEGTLKRIDAGSATQQMTQIVAVYPYNENYWLNWNTYNVEASLPAEQTYLADSYGLGSSLMVSSSEFNQLSFKNVCGWLKLQFTGSGYLSKIVLRGNSGEQVAGKIYVNSADASCILASEMGSTEDDGIGGTGGNLVFDDAILTEVTLNCDGGVALNPETPTAFYIALPPQTFEKGITIDVLWTDGLTMAKSTTNSLTIERNHILPMASTPAQPTPPANEIWYTSSTGNIVTPYATDVFGATTVSNTYENGKGIIKFNGNITSIGDDAFRGCKALTSINIPNSVTSIGSYAFLNCSALIRVDITDLEAWCKISFDDSYANPLCYADNLYLNGELLENVVIPESITELKDYVFYNADCIKSVTIHNKVTSIGNMAFADCHALKSVTIGNSVTEIRERAFQYCRALESVTIGNSVTEIGERAFDNCSALKRVNITDLEAWCKISFGEAQSNPVYYARNLYLNGTLIESLFIPNSVTSIGDRAFAYCDALKSVTISDSVTSIGNHSFGYCNMLNSVTMGNGVKTLGPYAFGFCPALTSVSIGNSITSIGPGVFSQCKALTSVIIPNSVTSIGYNAFRNCTSLKEVYCKPTTPPTADRGTTSYWKAFDSNASDRKIYVPTESVDAYKAESDWSDYASYIEPYEFTE